MDTTRPDGANEEDSSSMMMMKESNQYALTIWVPVLRAWSPIVGPQIHGLRMHELPVEVLREPWSHEIQIRVLVEHLRLFDDVRENFPYLLPTSHCLRHWKEKNEFCIIILFYFDK